MRRGLIAVVCSPLVALPLGCRQVLDIEDLSSKRDAALDGLPGASGAGGAGGSAYARGLSSATPLSCRGLAPICGPMGAYDCCETIAVPAGTFFRSNDPAYPATISAFFLDKYEVTVGRMRQLVDMGLATQERPPEPGSGAHPRIPDSGWNPAWNQYLARDAAGLKANLTCTNATQTFTEARAGNEARPVACVSWYLAFAFCALDGGRLPTEAEWNFAAAAGGAQWPYPWGSNPPDNTRAAFSCVGDGVAGCAITDVFMVGSRPLGNGLWGHSDLAGNVAEWLRDAYDPYATVCADCSDLRDGVAVNRITRGGDYAIVDLRELRTDVRGHSPPTANATNMGVRCARDMSP